MTDAALPDAAAEAARLTPVELVASEPGLARRAARAVLRAYGPILRLADAEEVARLAVEHAAERYTPERGSTFRDWGFWRACYAILTVAKKEHRHARVVLAMHEAVLARLSLRRPPAGAAQTIEALAEREAKAQALLAARASTHVDEMVEALWSENAEERVLRREDARRDAQALRSALSRLHPWERKVLAMRFEGDRTLEDAAAAVGLSRPALEERLPRVMARLRALLAAEGLTGMPSWLEDEGVAILRESAARDEAEGLDMRAPRKRRTHDETRGKP